VLAEKITQARSSPRTAPSPVRRVYVLRWIARAQSRAALAVRCCGSEEFAPTGPRGTGADELELVKARRYLEVRWGELLDEPRPGRPKNVSRDSHSDAERQQDARFRRLAAKKDRVVELGTVSAATTVAARSGAQAQ